MLKNSLLSDALSCYFGYIHCQINNYLRNAKDDECNIYREMADIISIWIAIAPETLEDIVLYRSIDEYQLELMYKHNKNNKSPYHEYGFMSCSFLKNICLNNEFFYNPYLLKIYAPKGIRGAYANLIDPRNEQELLLQRDCYLRFIKKPYIDSINEKISRIIFECQLIWFNE